MPLMLQTAHLRGRGQAAKYGKRLSSWQMRMAYHPGRTQSSPRSRRLTRGVNGAGSQSRQPIRGRIRRDRPKRRNEGLQDPVRTPAANTFAEGRTCTVRRELLDRTLVWNQRLERLVVAYIHHYNTHGPHRSLDQRPPIASAAPPTDERIYAQRGQSKRHLGHCAY